MGGLGEEEKVAAVPVTTTTATTESFPEGVYRYRLTKQDVLGLVPALTPKQIAEAIGTFTWTIRDGTISFHQTDCDCVLTRVSGGYKTTKKVLLVHWPAKAPNGTVFCSGDCIDTLGWSFDGTALQLTPVVPDRYAILFWGARKPWVKLD